MMLWLAKHYRPLVLATLVLAGLVFAFIPRPVGVDVDTVSRGPLSVSVNDEGITRVREAYVVTAPASGRLLRIENHVGDSVVANKTVVAALLPAMSGFRDPRTQHELEAALNASREAKNAAASGVDGAKASLDYAVSEHERIRKLQDKGYATKVALEQASRQLRTAKAALATAIALLQQKRSELKQAEAALLPPDSAVQQSAEIDIKSPVSGKVLRLIQESEAVVAAGSPLLEIGDQADLEIAADFLSRDAVRVSPGDAVIIENWGGDGILNGKVRRIEPSGVTKVSSLGIEEQRVNIIIDLTDPPEKWQRLGHGYHVDVRITVWEGSDVLQVPLSALFRSGEAWAVYRVEKGRARLRILKIGHMNDRHAQVLEGLETGDTVIVHPSDRVNEGALIKPRSRAG